MYFSERFACPVHGPILVSSSRGSSASTRHTAPARVHRARLADGDRPRAGRAGPALSIGEGRSRRGRPAPRSTTTSSTGHRRALRSGPRDRPGRNCRRAARLLPVRDQRRPRAGPLPQPVGRRRSYMTEFEGIIPNLERRYRETDSDFSRQKIEQYMTLGPARSARARGCGPSRARCRSADGDPRVHRDYLHRVAGSGCAACAEASTSRVSPGRCCARSRSGCSSWRAWASGTSRWIGRRRRFRAARRSGSGSPRRSAPRWWGSLHPRRAVDRSAPARQRAADRDARAPARAGQHGDRRRARRVDDARRGLDRRHGAWSRRARRHVVAAGPSKEVRGARSR